MSAGLKVKVPFIQEVNPIDKRVLEWDGNPSDMPTKDKLYISVDLFARWRITDPLQYFLRLRDERSAQSRLDDILGSETRNAVAKHELIEIIRTTKDRVPLRDTLLTEAERDMGSLVPIQKGRKLVEQESTGSGFCIHPEGYILTNAHVVLPVDRKSQVDGPGGLVFDVETDLMVVFTDTDGDGIPDRRAAGRPPSRRHRCHPARPGPRPSSRTRHRVRRLVWCNMRCER